MLFEQQPQNFTHKSKQSINFPELNQYHPLNPFTISDPLIDHEKITK